ncbi:MAG: hypothetical protein LBJ78_01680 [Puniceicoccales bacterium]|jgi:hypothetical protein|nr:hypothetical protein [Puniceicoccales bacterium]
MQKTVCIIIKAGFVAAGLMGVVTLNAWHCEHCQMEHEGPVCPISGNSPGGSKYDSWEDEVNPEDEKKVLQELKQRFKARSQKRRKGSVPHLPRDASPDTIPSTLPLVGYMPKGTPVYDSLKFENAYVTAARRRVIKVAGCWVYCTSIPGIFVGEGVDEVLDGDGNPIQPVDNLADDRPVYETPWQSTQYFASSDCQYFTLENLPDYSEIATYIPVVDVLFFHGRFVYNNYEFRAFRREDHDGVFFIRGAYFDGKQWIDKNTGKIYMSPEEMPPLKFDLTTTSSFF